MQPIMIKQAVTFAATPQGKPYDNYGYGLVGAFAIVYTCLAVRLQHSESLAIDLSLHLQT